jgi:hypothetical protein
MNPPTSDHIPETLKAELKAASEELQLIHGQIAELRRELEVKEAQRQEADDRLRDARIAIWRCSPLSPLETKVLRKAAERGGYTYARVTKAGNRSKTDKAAAHLENIGFVHLARFGTGYNHPNATITPLGLEKLASKPARKAPRP